MSQSSVIFFYLFAAFVVYITQRGELPKYLGLLLMSPKGGSAAPSGSTASNSSASDVASTAFDVGVKALPYLL